VEADGGLGARLHRDFCAEFEIREVCLTRGADEEEARSLAAHGDLAICGLECVRAASGPPSAQSCAVEE
jgi:hypothetical protein